MISTIHLTKSPKNTLGFSSTIKPNTLIQHLKKNALLKVLTMSNSKLHVILRITLLKKKLNGQDLQILLIAILFTLQLHMPDATGIPPFTSNGWLDSQPL